MRIMVAVRGVASLVEGRSALAQTCTAQNQITFDVSGQVVIETPTCGYSIGIEPTSYIVASKGSFANAMQITNPTPTSNTCTSPLASLNDCAGYSLDCQSCGTDPNGYSNEISCWCVTPETVPWNYHPAVPENDVTKISSRLFVDQNADGDFSSSEPIFSSDPAQNSGSQQVRYYQLHNQLVPAEWEDLNTFGNGDFNDYAAAIEPRICNGVPFPVLQNDENSRHCLFQCAAQTYPTCGNTILQSDKVSFHIAVGIDSTETEFDREGRGRLIRVAVTTYYSRQLREHHFTVCPALLFETANGSDPAMDIVKHDYAAEPTSTGCLINGTTSSEPTCRTEPHSKNYTQPVFPIGLAREQYYDTSMSCRTQRTVDDAFQASGRGTCAEQQEPGHTEIYELAIADLDAAISDPNSKFGTSTFSQIRDRLKYVQLAFIQYPEDGKFFCPSGVNAVIGGLNQNTPSTGTSGFETILPKLHPTTLQPNPNFNIYERE